MRHVHCEPILPAHRQPAGPVQGHFANSRNCRKSLKRKDSRLANFFAEGRPIPAEAAHGPTRQRSVSFPVF
jgi:hypothetical protein